MPNFNDKGAPALKTEGRHPGDEPLSPTGEAYAAQLWWETDASLRLDLARHGEIRRWSWKTLGEAGNSTLTRGFS